MVRFFCVVGPEGMAVADAGHAFLRALVDANIKVRALTIGPGGLFTSERRWYELGSAFTTLMSIPYVNVVCGTAGELLGQATPASTFAKSQDLPEELRRLLGPMADSKSADVEYVPQTVFAGLYTVGVKNVAIVTGSPDARELAALGKYDLVLFTSLEVWNDRQALFNRRADGTTDGYTCWFCSPESASVFPEILQELQCAFDTSATTEPSPGTDAQPATTSPPSTRPASSSRSSTSSSAPSPAPSTAIATSMHSWLRSSIRAISRMWSWCMRSLGFSKR